MPKPDKTTVTAATRKPLTRERVLKAAFDIADRQGISAVTMRSIAQKLGVEAMSLYKHVAGKEAVLDGLVEILLNKIDNPDKTTPWREAMTRRAWSVRQTVLSHPWAAVLIESRMAPSVARMQYGETVISCLHCAGFSRNLQYRAFVLIDSYVYGFVMQEVNWPHKENERKKVNRELSSYLKESPFPHLTAVMAAFLAREINPCENPYDEDFSFGLNLILDSLEKLRTR